MLEMEMHNYSMTSHIKTENTKFLKGIVEAHVAQQLNSGTLSKGREFETQVGRELCP